MGLALLACDAKGSGPSATGAPEMQAGGTDVQKNVDAAVVNRLATARCDQEEGCKNIGSGAKYDSVEVCRDTLRGSIGNDLNTYGCPRGLDVDAVELCIAAIRSEECNHPFDTLTRFDKCRTGMLCSR